MINRTVYRLVPATSCLILVALMSPVGHGYENWLFTSNNTDEEPGVRLTLDVDEWEMQSGATVSDVPCHDTSDSPEYIAWAPDGKSIGIARDELIASNPYIWAGVSADHSSASCPSADFTDDCIGGSFPLPGNARPSARQATGSPPSTGAHKDRQH